MNRRGFFGLLGAAAVVPFLPKSEPTCQFKVQDVVWYHYYEPTTMTTTASFDGDTWFFLNDDGVWKSSNGVVSRVTA